MALRIGPIAIMTSKTHDAYRAVVYEAWLVHELVWGYGENSSFPGGLEALPHLDSELSTALSYAPREDAPQ